ncbi:UNVERIFIED_ORG: hypothetical protein M2312_004857 [Rhizobium esperanzae]|nr:hypothetical protein [Rhizobium esperanzae]
MPDAAIDYHLQEERARKTVADFDNIRKGHTWVPVSWSGLASIQIAVDPDLADTLRFQLTSTRSKYPALPFGIWRKITIGEVDTILEEYLRSHEALIEGELGQALPFERLPDHFLDLLRTDLQTWSLAEYDDAIATLELCAAYATGADRRAL